MQHRAHVRGVSDASMAHKHFVYSAVRQLKADTQRSFISDERIWLQSNTHHAEMARVR